VVGCADFLRRKAEPIATSRLPLAWIDGDGKLLIGVRGLRTFSHSAVTVLVAIYLDLQGFSLVEVGLFLTLGSTGAASAALLAGIFGDAFGRRRMLAVFSGFMALTGLALVLTASLPILAIAALLGGFSAFAGAAGGLGPLEQAILPTTAPNERRTDLFAVYGIVGAAAVAFGSLAAGLPSAIQHFTSLDQAESMKIVFAGYAITGAIVAALYLRLSSAAEVPPEKRASTWVNPFRLPSRRRIFTMSGLFTVDSFGTGLIPQGLASYYFFTRFDLDPEQLGLLFFASSVLTAVSLWIAARMAGVIGLVNTMVFTHIPSSVFLMAVPLVPAAWMAIALWLMRAFFSQMDVPTSQSYMMAIVRPEERTAMASAGMVSRSAGIAAGPSVSTALWSATSAAVPFMIGGTVKITYDLALWLLFKRVKPPEEE
jgi:MFS family permease